MRVAVVGAGNVGSALANGIVRAGHDVRISSLHVEHAETAARASGAMAAASNADAVRDAEVVIFAVPASAHEEVAEELADLMVGKTAVDVTNVLDDEKTGLTTERSAAEELQDMLPGAHVVKAFNTVFASNQAGPVIDGISLDGFYAGDDEMAKQQVRSILADMGYRPIDVGPLKNARALEYLGLVFVRLAAETGWSWKPGWKLLGGDGPDE